LPSCHLRQFDVGERITRTRGSGPSDSNVAIAIRSKAFLDKMHAAFIASPAHPLGQTLEYLALLIAKAALRAYVYVLSKETAVIFITVPTCGIGQPGTKK
jgi:hypothetical protein